MGSAHFQHKTGGPDNRRITKEKPSPSYGDGFVEERRGWDLNPRGTYAPAGFQDRCNLDGTDNQANGLQLVSDSGCTNGCTRETENDRGCTSVESATEPVDAELSKVIGAWPTLPEHLKAAVMALVATAYR